MVYFKKPCANVRMCVVGGWRGEGGGGMYVRACKRMRVRVLVCVCACKRVCKYASVSELSFWCECMHVSVRVSCSNSK